MYGCAYIWSMQNSPIFCLCSSTYVCKNKLGPMLSQPIAPLHKNILGQPNLMPIQPCNHIASMLVRTHHIHGCPCPCSEAIRDPSPCPLTHANLPLPWVCPTTPTFCIRNPLPSIFVSSFFCHMFVLGLNLCHVILFLWKPFCFLSKNDGE